MAKHQAPTTFLDLRCKAWSTFREHEAICFLTGMMCPELAELHEREEIFIDQVQDESILRSHWDDSLEALAKLRSKFNVQVQLPELNQAFEVAVELPEGSSLGLRKHTCMEFFPGHTYGIEQGLFERLPRHATIMISWSGTVEWGVLEAKVFEDMAALSNLAERAILCANSKNEIKAAGALYRAAALQAVNLVEAYINGVALDYYYANHTKLDEKTKGSLLDWDFQRDRPRYLSLRDKLLQYPRLVLGLTHSPLQESNCPELQFVVGAAKDLRDSLAHPAPDWTEKGKESLKERVHYERSPQKFREVIDVSVSLVKKLERAVRGNDTGPPWLFERDVASLFPDQAFD